jgi:fructose-1,6-bisphosphatase/inositol monophosphatase family enzyme
VTPDAIVELFVAASDAVAAAVRAIDPPTLRDRTERAGQYALDLVADAAACGVLARAGMRIVSEESGVHDGSAELTFVVDPVDGSTNCARGIAYWATSLCALDADGPLVALVTNHAAGEPTIAVRGSGATRGGRPLRASAVTDVGDAVVGLGGYPETRLAWKQSRALGCCSLMLCDVAAGGLDAYIDAGRYHAPWDYLGGMLACQEAGAVVVDAHDEPLNTIDAAARRQLVAAGTVELAQTLRAKVS